MSKFPLQAWFPVVYRHDHSRLTVACMSDQLVRLAQVEEATLLAELRQHPAFGKLEAVRALMTAYRVQAAPAVAASAVQPLAPPSQPSERPETLGRALQAVSKDHFNRTGRRAQVGELMGVVVAAGVKIRGAKPTSTLSSFLSHHPDFNNVRGQGYGLAQWGESSPSETLLSRPVAERLNGADFAPRSEPSDETEAA